MQEALYCFIFLFSISCNTTNSSETQSKTDSSLGRELLSSKNEQSNPDHDPYSPYPLCLYEN